MHGQVGCLPEEFVNGFVFSIELPGGQRFTIFLFPYVLDKLQSFMITLCLRDEPPDSSLVGI